ncbi:PTS sugar transporter subunit IIA [Pectinatus frisingensis]|jgi:PTS system galactitol-specific IIA component|uniref:PTS sugar transporter subunit IIA n=1 Tax=Pectinatus frisingensis TaxID=865 RepID=UPI0015F470EC|nr:PTS sugar transporter subunit IIA [Pectinatus frisingensis]
MQVTVNEKLILLDLMGKDRETLLGKMADNLCENGFVKNTYKDAILAREKIFPTGLPTQPYGVAIPHTDIEHVNTPAISIARFKEPVEFTIMGEKDVTVPVKLAFMLAMKEKHTQLDMLQKLMAVLQNEDALNFLAAEQNSVSIKTFIQEKLDLKG